jgi:hypothetical protein
MKVIRGKYNDETVLVLSTSERNGFEIAGEMGLEGIPCGAARFVGIWHTDVQVESELTDKILREVPDDLMLALIIEFAEQENVGLDQRATMQRPRKKPGRVQLPLDLREGEAA